MDEEKIEALSKATKVTNVLLTLLTTMVAGFFLQSGVSGLLWVLCWAVALYGVFTISAALTVIVVSMLGIVLRVAATASKASSEDARLQKLNEIYNQMNSKK